MITYTLTCSLCGQVFPIQYRPSADEGLCSLCFQADRLRELDRLLAARHHAHKAGLPTTLTLADWIATIVRFGGRCGYCETNYFSVLDLFEPEMGLTASNVIPACRGCLRHKANGFEAALERIAAQLNHMDYTRIEASGAAMPDV